MKYKENQMGVNAMWVKAKSLHSTLEDFAKKKERKKRICFSFGEHNFMVEDEEDMEPCADIAHLFSYEMDVWVPSTSLALQSYQ